MERKSRERDREKEGGGEEKRTFEGAGGIREICVCVCVHIERGNDRNVGGNEVRSSSIGCRHVENSC
jgi:hypothetical protein